MNEKFVAEDESSNSIKNTFILLGYIVAAVIVLISFAWAYYRTKYNQFMLLIVLSCMMVVYSLIIMSVALINKEVLDIYSFEVLFNMSIFSLFLFLAFIIFFALKIFDLL